MRRSNPTDGEAGSILALSLGALAVAAVLIIVAVSLLAPRVGVAAPILLVVVGLIGSFIPGIPQVAISPE